MNKNNTIQCFALALAMLLKLNEGIIIEYNSKPFVVCRRLDGKQNRISIIPLSEVSRCPKDYDYGDIIKLEFNTISTMVH